MLPARRILAVLSFVSVLVASPCFGQVFVFHLSGAQEVPPLGGPSSGGCYAELDAGAGELDLVCVHYVIGASLMHIHRGAPGVNGPIVFDLGSPTSPVTATWTGMSPSEVADVLAGDLYLNVHSSGRPSGEIRGQILERTVDTVAFQADPGQVVPPVPPGEEASCVADLDAAATALDVDCTHDVTNPTEAHVHRGARGSNGPAIFTFPSPASPISGSAPLIPIEVAEFAAGFLYFDIHSVDSPGGAVRGQIFTPPAPPSTGTLVVRKRTLPVSGASFDFSASGLVPASFSLVHGGPPQTYVLSPGTYSIVESDPAPGHFLSDLACNDADSDGNVFTRTATVELSAGETVTCTFENVASVTGAETYFFPLSGGQEVPSVPSPASGGCAGLFSSADSSLTLVCSHDVAGPTLMHVHRAPAGANGPVVFDLGDPESPVQAVWTGMTPAEVADLRAGNLYVNIHTSGRPGGEIRGQIVPGPPAPFSFLLSGSQQVPPDVSGSRGSCTAELSADGTSLALACTHTVSRPTVAHVHNAPFGVNGPIVIELGDASSPFSVSVPMTPRTVAELLAGFLYVNVHSEDSPGGELRGQIARVLPAGAEIPSLGVWGLLALLALLGGAGVRRLARLQA